MWIEEIKNMATNEQWKVIKNALQRFNIMQTKQVIPKELGQSLLELDISAASKMPSRAISRPLADEI